MIGSLYLILVFIKINITFPEMSHRFPLQRDVTTCSPSFSLAMHCVVHLQKQINAVAEINELIEMKKQCIAFSLA